MEYILTERGEEYLNWLLERKAELTDEQQRRFNVLLRAQEDFPLPSDPEIIDDLVRLGYMTTAEVTVYGNE